MSSQVKPLGLSLLIAVIGCHRSEPCSDNECSDADDNAAHEDEGNSSSDLPCGGADLQSDDLNCGACGNACEISYADTPYSSGHCTNGKCRAQWDQCSLLSDQGDTCEELCALSNTKCVARGCPGEHNDNVTALLFESPGPCLTYYPVKEELVQDCDDIIEYEHNGNYWSAHCCCI